MAKILMIQSQDREEILKTLTAMDHVEILAAFAQYHQQQVYRNNDLIPKKQQMKALNF